MKLWLVSLTFDYSRYQVEQLWDYCKDTMTRKFSRVNGDPWPQVKSGVDEEAREDWLMSGTFECEDALMKKKRKKNIYVYW